MPEEKTSDRLAIAHPRCEVGETLQGGRCEFPGEVEFGGVLLCRRHARRFEAQDRVDLLGGIVSSLELSLSSIPLRQDKNLTLVLRAQRARAFWELDRAHEDLRRAREDEPDTSSQRQGTM